MKSVCDFFEEIMKIPRESSKEEKIASFIINYAKENNIEYSLGKYNTIFLRKNNNSDKTIILQAHSDMVCVSTNDFDFDNNGIPYYIDGDYYKSKCTSLGADDGVGVSLILAILQENENMPNIEVMITTQEETTMLGAMNFDYSLLTGKTLINLDGVREAEIESSSAGMCSVILSKKIKFIENNNFCYKLSVSGLAGGHSGDDINKGRANAINSAFKMLNCIDNVKIAKVDIGKRDNVIPNEGNVTFFTNLDMDSVKERLSNIDLKLSQDDYNFSFSIERVYENRSVIESTEIINFLHELKSGVVETYSDGFPLLSANIGKISIEDDNFLILYSIRSSDKKKENDLIDEINNLSNKYGFVVNIDSVKPLFPFKESSEIRKMLQESYKELFGKETLVKKIHACMECGLLSSKIKDLDICTIAPTIEHCHSVNENVSISSINRVYLWLKDTLQRFNNVNIKRIEYVDIYDRNKNKTGIKKIRKVDKFEDGEYIIGVQLVLLNNNNEILITKRSKTKKVLPEKWECNGGAIDAGETSFEGLEREIREELGITLDKNKVVFFKSVINESEHVIKDIYLYKENIDIVNIKFPDGEVCEAKYVSIDEFMDMFNSGDIVFNVNFNAEDYKKAIKLC